MRHKISTVIILLLFVGASLSAQSLDFFEGTDIKNRDVETLDLSEAGKDKLKLGVSLGYPGSGFIAGWQVGKSLELDAFAGSWNYDSLCLGAGAMISLVNVEIGGEIFPLTAGPFVNVGFGNDFSLSAGGVVRMEYTFDFNLNLYLESGLAVNFTTLDSDPLGIPVSLGVRYVF